MLTLGAGIDQILAEVLIGTYRGHWNTLKGDITTTLQTDITVGFDIMGIGDGSILAVQQELMYVVPGGVNPSAKTLTVLRGFMGTIAGLHPNGCVIEINPRYPRSNVLNTMLEEVESWPDELFRTQALTTTVLDGTTAIDVDALMGGTGSSDVNGVLRVYRQKQGFDSGRWIPLSGWRYESNLDQVDPNAQGSGTLFLNWDPCWDVRYGSARTIRILVARGFTLTPWGEATDPMADLGIPPSMHEIIKYGAAWRLVTGREGRRLFTEAETESRKAQEVPVQATAAFGQMLKKLRDARISEEIDRLRRQFPVRRSSG
jgi:hypothetical protein